mmetsp:Transcript_33089/g.40666  ORF Transcript_33089/g.40666 Transcript_33089/m.40666 type:complete len:172 (-) Transcript_33089:30-545(-)
MLQPTRVFGDGYYKNIKYYNILNRKLSHIWKPPYVTSKPEITSYYMTNKDKFIIIGSDGLFQDLTNETVINIVGKIIDNNSNTNISTELIKNALIQAGNHSGLTLNQVLNLPDNMKRRVHDDITVISIILDNQDTCLNENETDNDNNGYDIETPNPLKELFDITNKTSSKL